MAIDGGAELKAAQEPSGQRPTPLMAAQKRKRPCNLFVQTIEPAQEVKLSRSLTRGSRCEGGEHTRTQRPVRGDPNRAQIWTAFALEANNSIKMHWATRLSFSSIRLISDQNERHRFEYVGSSKMPVLF
jgi:hypothetical protein